MTEQFFKKKKAAAAFKHAILARYPVVFAGKLGSTSQGNRIVFLDGYAGRGEYDDGSPGSPLLLAQTADRMPNRDIVGYFVEQNKANAKSLSNVLARSNTTMNYTVLQGDLTTHLPRILNEAGQSPLFAFLDPFGTALDYEHLRSSLLGRRKHGTEVLLHFTTSGVARIGGVLHGAAGRTLDAVEAKQIEAVNRFLGGDWWGRHFDDYRPGFDGLATEIAIRISEQFTEIVRTETGHRAVTMPIRPRPELLPKYILALFTRSNEGLWFFADTLGSASLDWQEAWIAEDEETRNARSGAQGMLEIFEEPSWRFDRNTHEDRNKGEWIRQIQENVEGLLDRGPFRPDEQVVAVYGTTLGVARAKHVRQAIKNLHLAGVVENTGVGNFYREQIRRVRPR